MGILDPTPKEITYIRETFFEAARLKGQPVKIQKTDTLERNVLNDLFYKYNLTIDDINVLFENYPDKKVLQSAGWITNTKDQLPFVIHMYISNLIDLSIETEILYTLRGSKISIPDFEIPNIYKDYMIVDLYRQPNFVYLAKLQPFFDKLPKTEFKDEENKEKLPDNVGGNYKYIKVGDESE